VRPPQPREAHGAARHLPSLTGLRWVTALLIFGHHIMAVEYFTGTAATIWLTVFKPGSVGVTMFFVLSGFVLAWGHVPGQRPGAFWIRRVARVYPLHLVGVGLALVAAATVLPEIASPGVAPVVANVFLVNGWVPDWWQSGNPVSWSLVVEAFFYFCFPLLIWLLARRSARVIGAVVAVSTVLVAVVPAIAAASPIPMSAASTPLLRLPEFVIGMGIALLLKNSTWRPPHLSLSVALSVVGYAAFIAPSVPGTEIYPALAFTVLAFALLIASLAERDMQGRPTFLARRTWQELGTASFAFYVVHLLVIGVVASPWPGGHPHLHWPLAIALMTVAFAISLGLAWLLHRTVEVPLQRRIVRAFSKPAPAPRTVPTESRELVGS